MKFLEIFNPIEKGNYALTEEAIYASICDGTRLVPLYGGNKTHCNSDRTVSISTKTKKGQQVKLFSGKGIVISLDGSAGSMTYKDDEEFVLNHHAGFITLRPDTENIVDLEFFSLFFQGFYRSLAVSDGSKTLSLTQIYDEEIELPAIGQQHAVMSAYRKIVKGLDVLGVIKIQLLELLDKELSGEYESYQKIHVPIKSCIGCMSGNSGLTEEFIYQTSQIDTHTKYQVLSSSTQEETLMGEIPSFNLNGRPIKVFENQEGLLVTRNGNAGQTKYLEPGRYTINDHAYILYLKTNSKYEINLKWLAIQYREQFLQYSSNADNGTWNMSGFFKHTLIDIPEIEEQIRVVKTYDKVYKYIEDIEKIESQIDTLLMMRITE